MLSGGGSYAAPSVWLLAYGAGYEPPPYNDSHDSGVRTASTAATISASSQSCTLRGSSSAAPSAHHPPSLLCPRNREKNTIYLPMTARR